MTGTFFRNLVLLWSASFGANHSNLFHVGFEVWDGKGTGRRATPAQVVEDLCEWD